MTQVLKATYTCRDATGESCSAGCGSASFSPLKSLTVILGSVPIGNQSLPMYYYLAVFPQTAEKSAKSAAKAEGFILSTSPVCGTVNMDLTFSDP